MGQQYYFWGTDKDKELSQIKSNVKINGKVGISKKRVKQVQNFGDCVIFLLSVQTKRCVLIRSNFITWDDITDWISISIYGMVVTIR